MKKTELPYIEVKKVKGREYIYFRRDAGGKVTRFRLPDNPDSEEFSRQYWAIRSGRSNRICKTTWNNLIIAYYRSPAFRAKARGSKRTTGATAKRSAKRTATRT